MEILHDVFTLGEIGGTIPEHSPAVRSREEIVARGKNVASFYYYNYFPQMDTLFNKLSKYSFGTFT